MYRTIRAIDPTARIVGPNFANYDSDFYRDFLAFDPAERLPAGGDLLARTERRIFQRLVTRAWRITAGIERSLGIPPREICINEYSRITGDLGNPGKLVQWIARFEHSKVDACLAYWTDAGSLNNLVTRDNYNRASGAWWLYRWYGGMSGHTVRVTPPDERAEGLQGLACLDLERQQARILFGGSAGQIELEIQEIEATPCFHSRSTPRCGRPTFCGLAPSEEPRLLFCRQPAGRPRNGQPAGRGCCRFQCVPGHSDPAEGGTSPAARQGLPGRIRRSFRERAGALRWSDANPYVAGIRRQPGRGVLCDPRRSRTLSTPCGCALHRRGAQLARGSSACAWCSTGQR